MYGIAKIPSSDREDLFRNTAQKMKLHEAIVEKDFWVCWVLDYLFHRCAWKDSFTFKGGTSLSKGYDLIQRFSEDIDLIMDWGLIGYEQDEPWKERSKTKQDAFNKEANRLTENFLGGDFIETLKQDFSNLLCTDANLHIDAVNKQTIRFAYPRTLSDTSILQEICLEIGTLAAWTPAEQVLIEPYAAKQYPQLFDSTETSVLTVKPERTFWEKVTILHREANRNGTALPQRYSRHYYDLYCMSQSEVKEKAFSEIDLLKKVVAFKEKFYPCAWAKYEDAKIGSMKLMPKEEYIEGLKSDYQHMRNMIYGDQPPFEDVLNEIEKMEVEINALQIKN